MKRLAAAGAAAVLALGPVATSGAARDDGNDTSCPTASLAIGHGTLPVGNAGADFGTVPEACVGTDVWLRARGSLLVAADAPDFNGSVAAAGNVRLRFALGPRWMASAAVDVATFRFVQNAVVSSTSLDAGPATLGLSRSLIASPRWALAAYSRALLPFDTARAYGATFGGELGATTIWIARPGLGLQGGAGFSAPVTIVAGQTHAALGSTLVAEAWASGPRLAGILGAFGRFPFVPASTRTLSIGARTGVRAALGRRFWLAAIAEIPLAGGDRTDLLAALFLGFTPN